MVLTVNGKLIDELEEIVFPKFGIVNGINMKMW